MIELSLGELAVRVIGGSMGIVLLLVASERRRSTRRERRAVRDRVICRLCLAVFEASSRDPEQICPECGGATDRKGPRPLG